MSHEANITRDDGWHRGEHKFLSIPVYSDAELTVPVDLTNIALRWLLLRQAGGTLLLEKEKPGGGITVTGGDDNVALIEIEVADYVSSIPANVYYHELWDEDADVMLCYGTAYLGHGREAS